MGYEIDDIVQLKFDINDEPSEGSPGCLCGKRHDIVKITDITSFGIKVAHLDIVNDSCFYVKPFEIKYLFKHPSFISNMPLEPGTYVCKSEEKEPEIIKVIQLDDGKLMVNIFDFRMVELSEYIGASWLKLK